MAPRPVSMAVGPVAFYFRQRYGKLDWGKLSRVDVDAVVREVDLEVLQSLLDDIAFCRFEEGDLAALAGADGLSVKLVRISQLIVEYLLHVQECQERALGSLVQQLEAATKRNDELEAAANLSRAEAAAVRREAGHYRSALDTCNNLLRQYGVDAGPILQNLSALSQPPFTFVRGGSVAAPPPQQFSAMAAPAAAPAAAAAAAGPKSVPARVCQACGKAFVSEEYLAKHMERRHRGFRAPEPAPPKADAAAGDGEEDDEGVDAAARRLAGLVAASREREKDAAIAALRAELERLKGGGPERRRRHVQAMLRLRALLYRRNARENPKYAAFARWKAAAAIAPPPRKKPAQASHSVQAAPPPMAVATATQSAPRLSLEEVLGAVYRRVELSVDAKLGTDGQEGETDGNGYANPNGFGGKPNAFAVTTASGSQLRTSWRLDAAEVEAARQQALAELHDRGRRLGLDVSHGRMDGHTYVAKLAEATVRRERLHVPDFQDAFAGVEDELMGLQREYYDSQGPSRGAPPSRRPSLGTYSRAAEALSPPRSQKSGGYWAAQSGGFSSYNGYDGGYGGGYGNGSPVTSSQPERQRGIGVSPPRAAEEKEEEEEEAVFALTRRSEGLNSESWRRRGSLAQAERVAAIAAAAAAELARDNASAAGATDFDEQDAADLRSSSSSRNSAAKGSGAAADSYAAAASRSGAANRATAIHRKVRGSSTAGAQHGVAGSDGGNRGDGGGGSGGSSGGRTPQDFPDVGLPHVSEGGHRPAERQPATGIGSGARAAAAAAAAAATAAGAAAAVTAQPPGGGGRGIAGGRGDSAGSASGGADAGRRAAESAAVVPAVTAGAAGAAAALHHLSPLANEIEIIDGPSSGSPPPARGRAEERSRANSGAEEEVSEKDPEEIFEESSGNGSADDSDGWEMAAPALYPRRDRRSGNRLETAETIEYSRNAETANGNAAAAAQRWTQESTERPPAAAADAMAGMAAEAARRAAARAAAAAAAVPATAASAGAADTAVAAVPALQRRRGSSRLLSEQQEQQQQQQVPQRAERRREKEPPHSPALLPALLTEPALSPAHLEEPALADAEFDGEESDDGSTGGGGGGGGGGPASAAAAAQTATVRSRTSAGDAEEVDWDAPEPAAAPAAAAAAVAAAAAAGSAAAAAGAAVEPAAVEPVSGPAPEPFRSRYGGFEVGAGLAAFPKRQPPAGLPATPSTLRALSEDLEVEEFE